MLLFHTPFENMSKQMYSFESQLLSMNHENVKDALVFPVRFNAFFVVIVESTALPSTSADLIP